MQLLKTDLFLDGPENLLPYDGEVDYYGKIIGQNDAQKHYEKLLKTSKWRHASMIMYDKLVVTKREVAWYGDEKYRATHSTLPWTDELSGLKEKVEDLVKEKFNCCFLNLYHDGSEGIAWHSDNEEILGPEPVIASLSFGAERKFCLKHKNKEKAISVVLENGSLLVMKGITQKCWLHSVPKSKMILSPRINLTFRRIVD